MDELTQRLASGNHPVIVGALDPSVEDLKLRLEEIGRLSIKFTDTEGGTDLPISVDRGACDLDSADFDQSRGTVHIEGTLTLNEDPVRCIADIDLATLGGTGRLVPVVKSAARD